MLFLAGGDDAVRAAAEWAAEHLRGFDAVHPVRAQPGRPVGRLSHPPFAAPPEEAIALSRRVAGVLGAHAGIPPGSPVVALEAAVLAVLLAAPLVAAGTAAFRDLLPFAAWSMNVPSRPADALLARHAAIAARPIRALEQTVDDAAAALLAGAPERLEASRRRRRREARRDGPVRFRRIRARSAGLRPLAIYLDLLPGLAAAGRPAQDLLREAGPDGARRLLGISIALFV